MIYNYPFSTSPYIRRPYSRNYSSYSYAKINSVDHSLGYEKNNSNNNHEKKDMPLSNPKNMDSELSRSEEKEVFEIFGIKLYFDDILLICLIFFLYNEGVKDQSLFIILILLLLT